MGNNKHPELEQLFNIMDSNGNIPKTLKSKCESQDTNDMHHNSHLKLKKIISRSGNEPTIDVVK